MAMVDGPSLKVRYGERTASAIFSINNFAAALIALYVGFSIGLPRPYWAMLTVYITAQPLTGALRSKALYRVMGTALGGAAAVVIVPTFVTRPFLMSAVMAGWSGLCLYVSLLDRTPRAYVFMLAGYTAAIIGFPSVNAPGAVFQTALARVEEITLGIGCATIVHTIVFPRDVGQVLGGRIARLLKDAGAWIGDALSDRRSAAEREERRRMATDLTELHITASHLPFDTANLPLRKITVHALESRLAYMLPLISAIEDRLSQLERKPEDLELLLSDVVVWAEEGAAADQGGRRAQDLILRALAMAPAAETGVAAWDDLLTISILTRVQDLILALQDGRDLARFTELPTSLAKGRVRELLRAAAPRRLHLDPGKAALSGAALMVAVLVCCVLWIFTAWPEGYVAAMMAAVFSSFFAAQDDPAPAILSFLLWTLASIPLGAVYLFAVLPAIDGFPMLALALAPALLVVGYFQPSPKWGSGAMAMMLGFAGGIALQPEYAANMPDYLDSNLAECVGVAMALATARVLRSAGAGWAAKRILKQGWRELSALARSSRRLDADRWIGAMLDRVGLVNERIALSGPEDTLNAYDALADMRVGLNVIDLRKTADETSGEAARSINAALIGVAETYEARLLRSQAEPSEALLTVIDQAIGDLSRRSSKGSKVRGFAALTGLRRNLFPGAEPYAPQLGSVG